MKRILAAALLLAAPDAFAWGPYQHKAIAHLAQDRLNPGAAQGVANILGPTGRLDQIADCPDTLLHSQGMVNCGGLFSVQADTAGLTRLWHFIDVPISATGMSVSNIMSYCPNGSDCVIEQIRRQSFVLINAVSSQYEKQVALMFLVHFVGDEHQPLHCADDNDFGGNKKPVVIFGVTKNLHSLWDDYISPDDWKSQSSKDSAALAATLEADISAGNRPVGDWTSGEMINQAAVESFEVAQSTIYPHYAIDGGQNLGVAYQRQMQPIAMVRMEAAGVRLAEILNRIFP